MLYAFTSAANNNGSAFAGLTVATTWYDIALGAASTVDTRGTREVRPNPAAPRRISGGLLDPAQWWRSLPDALRKLDPRTLWRNPVMLIVEVGAVFTPRR